MTPRYGKRGASVTLVAATVYCRALALKTSTCVSVSSARSAPKQLAAVMTTAEPSPTRVCSE